VEPEFSVLVVGIALGFTGRAALIYWSHFSQLSESSPLPLSQSKRVECNNDGRQPEGHAGGDHRGQFAALSRSDECN
jgi:hypothetical protein